VILDLDTPLGITLALLPELVLTLAAVVALLATAWRHTTAADSRLVGWISLVGTGLATVALGVLWAWSPDSRGSLAMVAMDGFRYASLGIILLATAGSILFSLAYMEREELNAPEYYVLILLAATGMLFLAGATDLIVLFLGLEVMSVAVYVLAGYDRRSRFSSEAALKYFLIGAFASAFLLYGIALLYGATGHTDFRTIGLILQPPVSTMGALGIGLLLVGLAFKVSAVPFHMWAPDVYDGAPTPVTGFMATGVKAAGFVALTRVLIEALPGATSIWMPVLGVLAGASMVVGNLVALSQRSLKRMLAWSSVAHAGYLLLAVATGTRLGITAMLVYLLAYVLTTLATFGVLGVLGRGGERDVTLDSIAGLGRTRPGLSLALTISMLSLLGFPGTFGFIGKWTILTAAVSEHQLVLSVLLVVTSLVSAGFYLPVIMAMYMRPATDDDAHAHVWMSSPAAATVAFAVALVVVFGFWPMPALDTALEGARALVEATLRAP